MTEMLRVEGSVVTLPIQQNPVRTAVRFPICLDLTLQTEFGEFHGCTENISANGILFVCRYLPNLSGPIEFTMAMPGAVLGTERDVQIHCIGRIVRREPGMRETKAAVVIDEYFLKA